MVYDPKKRKEEYEWLKSHGMCVNCHNKEAMHGSIYCYECWEKSYDKNGKYDKEHIQENRERMKVYGKKRYAELKAKGICTKCGKHKAVDGETLCLSCKAKKNSKKDPRWNNDIARSMRPSLSLCYVCGKPLNNYEKLCDSCHEKHSENMKRLNENPTPKMIAAREKYTQEFRNFRELLYQSRKNHEKRIQGNN